ncbi:MAG: universal stress protein [Nitrospiraceae bacterium]
MKIVLGMDGSKYGRWAAEWVARMPFDTPPRVTAVHVVDLASLRAPMVIQPLGAIGPLVQAEARRLQARAKRVVAETKTLLSSLDLQEKVITEKGAIAPTILKHVAGRGDLLVVGARGLDALDRFMLGSISTKVTLHAPCSVLVVKQPPRPIRRILLATDGSKWSDKALKFLLQKLQPDGPSETDKVEVLVMHVLPSFAHTVAGVMGTRLVHRYAERLAKAGYRMREMARSGHVADEIVKAADRQKTDLIVVGARGLGAGARFFLGSVSTRVVQHSSCSVLVVR